MLELESEQEKIRVAVIKCVKEAYRASMNTRVPSLRTEICPCVTKTLEIPCYPDKLQSCFRPEIDGPRSLMKRICSGVSRLRRIKGDVGRKSLKKKRRRSCFWPWIRTRR